MGAFSDEQLAALNELLEKREEGLTKSLESTLSGVFERSRKSDPTLKKLEALETELGGLKGSLGETVKSQMDGLLEELASQALEEEKTRSTSSNNSSTDNSSSPNVDELVKSALREFESKAAEERKKTEKRLKMAEEALAKAEEEKKALAERDRKQQMENAALAALSGKVASGKERRALQAMLAEGTLVEDPESGAYRVKTKDKYGETVLADPAESIGEILEKAYSEYLPPRGGTGTGGSATNSATSSTGTFDLLKEDLTPQELHNMALTNPEALKKFDAQLAAAIQ